MIKLIYSWILNKIRLFGNTVLGHRNYRKVVIICQARTGSNLLVSLLNSHLNVSIGGEIFDSLNGNSTEKVWNKHFKKYSKKIKAVGFKIFYQHPFDGEKDVWDIIKNDPSILIIHLIRKNTLRSFVSLKIAEKTNRWHDSINSKDIPVNKNIRVDLKEYSQYCNETLEYIDFIKSEFSKFHEYIEFNFEDFVVNKQQSVDKVINKIGIKNMEVTSKMIRQNSESLSNLIVNFEEVESFIKNTNNKEFISFITL